MTLISNCYYADNLTGQDGMIKRPVRIIFITSLPEGSGCGTPAQAAAWAQAWAQASALA